jgi:hypothetical protein
VKGSQPIERTKAGSRNAHQADEHSGAKPISVLGTETGRKYPMSRKMIAGFISLVALVVFGAVPAMAFASPELQTSAGAKVAVGTEIKGTSGNLVFTTAKGNLECKESVLSGAVTENTGTHIQGTISKASFTAVGGGKCATTIPGVTTEITPENLPWCLTTVGTNEWTLNGGDCTSSKPIAFEAHIFFLGAKVTTCTFSRTEVTGSYNTNASPLKLKVGASQTFSYVAGNKEFCAEAGGTLTGEFTLKTAAGGELKIV